MPVLTLCARNPFQFAQQDFYHVVKVDTHIHAASAVVAPKLLAFIKNKYATSPNVHTLMNCSRE